jgi:phosphoribosylanthranilate isomerase
VSVTLFLYEGAKSGQGEMVDWTRAADLAKNRRMVLAGGLSIDNVAEAIATVHPYGVDVSSGVESAPGQKDAQKIRDFISAAKAAGNNL